MLRERTKQKIYLARYGRQDVHSWDRVEVPEFLEYYEALSDLMRRENAQSGVASIQENSG